MGKILFFDLDGTLWDRAERIPPRTAEALRRARENGHSVFVNTGRTRVFALRPALREIGLDGMVTGCGTRLESRAEGDPQMDTADGRARVMYDARLDEGETEALVTGLEAEGFRVLLESPEYMYADMAAFRDDPYMRIVAERAGGKLLDLKACRGRWRASKMTFDMRLAYDREKALSRLGEKWNLFRHSRDVCELTPPGHDKAEGMRMTCRFLGASMADTVAFGDGANDVDMLRAAGLGVAMGGGAEEALRAADLVTAPLGEDGVGLALRRLGLI